MRATETRVQTCLQLVSVFLLALACGMLHGIDKAQQAQADASAVSMQAQISLLEQIAGNVRDPLRASWSCADGTTITVEVGIELGESDAAWQLRFDERVARNRLKYPPVEMKR